MFPRTFPPGLTTEIIDKELLKRFNKLVNSQHDREHLTTYFYRNPEGIKIKNIENPEYESIKKVKLVVDTNDDLKKARWIANKLCNLGMEFDISNVISLAKDYSSQVNIYKKNN